MQKTDLRTLDEPVKFELRKRAIALIESGKKKGDVAQLLGVNKNSITNWCKLYKENGVKGLNVNVRGLKPEEGKRLTRTRKTDSEDDYRYHA